MSEEPEKQKETKKEPEQPTTWTATYRDPNTGELLTEEKKNEANS